MTMYRDETFSEQQRRLQRRQWLKEVVLAIIVFAIGLGFVRLLQWASEVRK